MIAELLEKFEDIFTPHTPEEVEKRLPIWDVGIYRHGGGYSYSAVELIRVKYIEVHSQPGSFIKAVRIALKKLGLSEGELEYVKLWEQWAITIYPSDDVKGDDGTLLTGKYVIYGLMRR